MRVLEFVSGSQTMDQHTPHTPTTTDAIEVMCPCGSTHSFGRAFVGRIAKCPQLHRQFRVPPQSGPAVFLETDVTTSAPTQTQVPPSRTSPCFFCDADPADDECACSVSLCQIIRTDVPSALRELTNFGLGTLLGGAFGARLGILSCRVTALFRRRIVRVPRCVRCKAAHEEQEGYNTKAERKAAMIAGVVALIAGVFLLQFISLGISLAGIIAGLLLVAVFAALFGAPIGSHVASKKQRSVPAGVKPATCERMFPAVSRMVADGWVIGVTPNCGYLNADYIEVTPDKELDLPMSERCRWRNVDGEWSKVVGES